MSNRWSLPLVWLLLGGASLLAGDAAWEPEKTWVFAVGALQFDNPGMTAYPDKGRVDAVLLETFRKRGVPAGQILFIKNKEATKANITRQLAEFLPKPGKDDTLFFYYTGHGGRDYANPTRPVSFVTYDTKSTWSVSSMFDAIEQHFQGSQALLTADCCHSGGLAEEASRRAGKIRYGVLTSSQVASVSTGNWTFTQCLADLFAGKPLVDLNHDGVIGFSEAGQYCDAEMSFCEDQRATHVALGGFAKDMVLAKAIGSALPRVGEHCEAQNRGIWMKARILETKDDKFLVDWVGRDKLADAWLAADELRKYEPETLAVGSRVEVEWNNVWYAGKVRQTHLGLHLVHYEGFPDADDEWVPLRRLRPRPQ